MIKLDIMGYRALIFSLFLVDWYDPGAISWRMLRFCLVTIKSRSRDEKSWFHQYLALTVSKGPGQDSLRFQIKPIYSFRAIGKNRSVRT